MDLIGYLRSVFSAIANANGFFVLLAFAAVFVHVLFLCLKWKFSLNVLVGPQKLRKLLPIILGNLSIDNITPGRGLGGEPYKLYAGRKQLGVPVNRGFASIVFERFFDAISLAILLIIAFVFACLRHAVPSLTYYLVGFSFVTIVSFSLLLFFFICKRSRPLRYLIFKLAGRFKVKRQAKGFFDSFTASTIKAFKDFKAGMKVLGCALARWLCDLIRFVALIVSVGAWLNPEYILIALAISKTIGSIPLLPGGFGTFDATLGWLLTLFGLPSTTALAIVLINRGISYIPFTIAGFSAISYMHLPFKRG